MTATATLRTFRECSGDAKFTPLAESDIGTQPKLEVERELAALATRTGRSQRDIAVLDFGCGRGQLVGQLRAQGWRAFGVEVGERFVAAGAILSEIFSDEYPIISLVGADGAAPFPAGYFDLVVADQVFEHVGDLDKVAADIARLLKPGGILIGIYPAPLRPIEPHYRLPLVHWLPKGKLQTALIAAMVRAGLGVKPPAGTSRRAMAAIVAEYAAMETFYRSPREVRSIFARHGIALEFDSLPRLRMRDKLRRLSGVRRTLLLASSRLLPLVRMHNLFRDSMARGVKGNVIRT
jgi:SAM-dependent methyltransferase